MNCVALIFISIFIHEGNTLEHFSSKQQLNVCYLFIKGHDNLNCFLYCFHFNKEMLAKETLVSYKKTS